MQGPQRCWALPNRLERPYFEDLILYLEEGDSLSEAKIFAAQLPLARSLGQFQSHLQTRSSPEASRQLSALHAAQRPSWPCFPEEKSWLETQLGWEVGN